MADFVRWLAVTDWWPSVIGSIAGISAGLLFMLFWLWLQAREEQARGREERLRAETQAWLHQALWKNRLQKARKQARRRSPARPATNRWRVA